jgi:predicted nucleic acid-binding protein
LIEAWLRRSFDLVLSEHILEKAASAWTNPYFRARYREDEALRALALLRRRRAFVPPVDDVRGVAPNEEDDIVLATAVAGDVDYLVTGDIPFRSLTAYRGVVLLMPREFLELLKREESSTEDRDPDVVR